MEMKPVKSSNIIAAGYENGVMRVRFSNGTEYDYETVSPTTFTEFMVADSQGKFFHKNIKGKFTSTKVEEENDGEGKQ